MGITYKEFAWLINKNMICHKVYGGVIGCPGNIVYGEITSNICRDHGKEQCTKCWNREIPYTVIAEITGKVDVVGIADFNKEKLDQDTHVDAPADGGMVKMNMTINYNFIPEKVTSLYERFNGMEWDQIVESKVKNSILAYIKEVTPQFSVMDIYSDKRAEVGQAITEYLNSKLNEEYGINVSSALIIDVQLDEELQAKVQAKEQAKQDAEKAELDKQTALAQGEAAKAKAEADKAVTITNAEAEAEANRIKAASITDELIRMTEAEARKEHGWVTVQGADTVVTEEK